MEELQRYLATRAQLHGSPHDADPALTQPAENPVAIQLWVLLRAACWLASIPAECRQLAFVALAVRLEGSRLADVRQFGLAGRLLDDPYLVVP